MRTRGYRGLALAILLPTMACGSTGGAGGTAGAGGAGGAAGAESAGSGWLKGQTHAHTNRSGDSQTPPEDALRWYADHGFDFVVLTDHERVTDVRGDGRVLSIPGVELTQNFETCDPAPEPGFGCLLHVNALFATPPEGGRIPWDPPTSDTRVDLFARALDVTRALGAEAQLNHPNFHFAADAPLVVELARRGLRFLEIANMSSDSMNEGDAAHPDTIELWDAVLTSGATVWGVASDDAHHYDDAEAARAAGRNAFTGNLGWVMVRASRDVESIRAAMVRGDFYSTTGPILTRLELVASTASTVPTAPAPTLILETATPHRFRAIGSGGRLLVETEGTRASFALDAARGGGYVRAEIVDRDGKRAFTQPIRLP